MLSARVDPGPEPYALTQLGMDLIRQFESCRLHAYRPTPTDTLTIGWGATRNSDGSRIRADQQWTRAEADRRLDVDTRIVARQVAALLGNATTSRSQFDALVALAYNIGVDALSRSTLIREHRSGNHAAAAAEFARWNHQGGIVLRGLTRRRAAEAMLYRQADA